MREKTIGAAIDLLNLLMYFYVCFCCLTTLIYAITSKKTDAYFCFLLLPIMYLSYWIRTKVHNLWSFLLLHLCLIGGILFLPSALVVKIVLLACTIVFSIISLYLRLKGPEHIKNNASPLLLIIVIPCYLICSRSNFTFLLNPIQYGLLICTLTYCTNLYLINYRSYFLTNLEKVNVSMTRLKLLNHSLVGGFLLLSGALMLIVTKLPLSQLFHSLNTLLYRFLRWLFSHIQSEQDTEEPQVVEEFTEDTEPPAFILQEDTPKTPSAFWQTVERIAYVTFYVIVIAVILALIVFTCYQIYKKFHTPSTNGIEKKEFISPFAAKKEKEPKRNTSPHSFFLFASNRDKMRKHFYHQLDPKVNHDKVTYYTSGQITSSLNTSTSGLLPQSYSEADLNELHKLYDKARYSNEPCTKQDYQKMKKIRL